jgi:hypothetical protein
MEKTVTVGRARAASKKAAARVAKVKRQRAKYDPERAAAIAKIARETGYAAHHLSKVAKDLKMDLAQLDAWARTRSPERRSKRERMVEIAKIARETGYATHHLSNVANRDKMDLVQLAAWARAHSRQITVAGKTYLNKETYFATLSRRYRISAGTIGGWAKAYKIPLEDLAARALAAAKARAPDSFHRSTRPAEEVAAYGWRWRSVNAFSIYYFGYSGPTSAFRAKQSKPELSWGKAALPHLLHLFDSEQMGPDCRWSPEREAQLPPRYLPLNGRDAREHDEDDMPRWHAGIAARHAKLRATGEAARMRTVIGGVGAET